MVRAARRSVTVSDRHPLSGRVSCITHIPKDAIIKRVLNTRKIFIQIKIDAVSTRNKLIPYIIFGEKRKQYWESLGEHVVVVISWHLSYDLFE